MKRNILRERHCLQHGEEIAKTGDHYHGERDVPAVCGLAAVVKRSQNQMAAMDAIVLLHDSTGGVRNCEEAEADPVTHTKIRSLDHCRGNHIVPFPSTIRFWFAVQHECRLLGRRGDGVVVRNEYEEQHGENHSLGEI